MKFSGHLLLQREDTVGCCWRNLALSTDFLMAGIHLFVMFLPHKPLQDGGFQLKQSDPSHVHKNIDSGLFQSLVGLGQL